MATYSKELLSGSTDGKGIKVTQTATPGDTIHTAHATALDEVYLYVVNSGTGSVALTIQWGEATAPDGNIECSVPGESGLQLVIPGLLIKNSLAIMAFADTANVLIIHGFVNRIT